MVVEIEQSELVWKYLSEQLKLVIYLGNLSNLPFYDHEIYFQLNFLTIVRFRNRLRISSVGTFLGNRVYHRKSLMLNFMCIFKSVWFFKICSREFRSTVRLVILCIQRSIVKFPDIYGIYILPISLFVVSSDFLNAAATTTLNCTCSCKQQS